MGSSRLKPLTVKEIDKLAATRPRTIRHIGLGGVPGFVLVHTPAGHTSYALRYRVNQRLVKLTLGSTTALTLAEARSMAAEARTKVEKGGNPHGEKLAARAMVVKQEKLVPQKLWDKYMQLAASQLRSRGEKDRLYRKHIEPIIGKLCITEVKRAHALEVVDALVAAGLLRQADKVRQEGAAFFNWLLEREVVDRNVFAGIRKAQIGNTIRTRVLSDDELREIWVQSEQEAACWSQWIKLLILTGCRNNEVRSASWSEFDLTGRLWTIPAERAKNKTPQPIHLTDAMLDVLDEIARFTDSDFLFPAVRNPRQAMSGDQKVKDRVDARMRAAIVAAGGREPENWRFHDFRRTVATGLQRLGFRPDIADQVIGHVSSTRSGAAAHYLHYRYEEEKKQALEAWSAHVMRLLGDTSDGLENVVEMRR
ncbi:tyrosine-type recombinase/integrase [Novosphingopyxis sp.]|uniref:tyrosine-type recombinase/integrase n=1 Tax=Novosphingopyxis sp. TaxID=2709690 RepID=UPI003B58BCC1